MTLEEAIAHVLVFVEWGGYPGLFFMTFIESSFIPIPAEVTMIPAGYLVHEGKMSFIGVMLASTLGTVAGAYFNYWLALKYGRALVLYCGKYVGITEKKLEKMDLYFIEHGGISVFTGRLLPGIKHYISFPAGLAHMDKRRFLIYTTLGGGLWMLILLVLGYLLGANKDLLREYLFQTKMMVLGGLTVLIGGYICWRIWKKRRNTKV